MGFNISLWDFRNAVAQQSHALVFQSAQRRMVTTGRIT